MATRSSFAAESSRPRDSWGLPVPEIVLHSPTVRGQRPPVLQLVDRESSYTVTDIGHASVRISHPMVSNICRGSLASPSVSDTASSRPSTPVTATTIGSGSVDASLALQGFQMDLVRVTSLVKARRSLRPRVPGPTNASSAANVIEAAEAVGPMPPRLSSVPARKPVPAPRPVSQTPTYLPYVPKSPALTLDRPTPMPVADTPFPATPATPRTYSMPIPASLRPGRPAQRATYAAGDRHSYIAYHPSLAEGLAAASEHYKDVADARAEALNKLSGGSGGEVEADGPSFANTAVAADRHTQLYRLVEGEMVPVGLFPVLQVQPVAAHGSSPTDSQKAATAPKYDAKFGWLTHGGPANGEHIRTNDRYPELPTKSRPRQHRPKVAPPAPVVVEKPDSKCILGKLKNGTSKFFISKDAQRERDDPEFHQEKEAQRQKKAKAIHKAVGKLM